jgi:hypothetical protein
MTSSNEQDNFDRLAGLQGGGTNQPSSTPKEPVPEWYVNSPDPILIAKPFWRRPDHLTATKKRRPNENNTGVSHTYRSGVAVAY